MGQAVFSRKGVMKMMEIKGKVNTALCFAKVIKDEAIEQIRRMCDYEFTAGSRIRIMPDVHTGKDCTIGITMPCNQHYSSYHSMLWFSSCISTAFMRFSPSVMHGQEQPSWVLP